MQTPVQSFHATNPLVVCTLLMLATSTYCFVMGFLTGNYSKVDQLWSILPVVYSIIFAASSRWNSRLTVMAVLATLWGLRLTYNFARKGGYNGEEDYRWLVIRNIINNRVFFEIFNLIFISLFQNILLLLIALPSWAAYLNQEMPLNLVDLGALFLLVGSVLFETLADQEQWVFQNEKHRLLSQKGAVPEPSTDESIVRDYKRGFLTHGMFAFSRHPNFFFEQLVWWSYYLFAVAATGEVHWTIVGPVLLSMLFQGSTRFTEYITLEKYAIYKEYQKRVNMLLPWLPTAEETDVGDKTE
ncbi:hypothetical protein SARC_12314 [Sphaeroforma arctica JP610]|uniref:Steroid 5-alpha reductase C-terminal domain-containing protein n=1 Tax=Sphaeroforma arctica JP610 TaxID=667725 RepID=A0A0L0FGJ1_9EUKA|nr:hypothetical protein SARC_12314 [Sphaeroforma arctica JP610]KNC75153.1 hypothetical protein SARC_12314 [Sphaeroforma arctica JP610]|eukprot:XP_014149055.1 hypothetical protein SARC_12314 [Sphaeroforma arctica JP610]